MANRSASPAAARWRERKKSLSQYRRLLAEIRADRLRLAQLAGRLLRQNPAGLPEHTDDLQALGGYRLRVEENLSRCTALVEELQSFINGIGDSELRRLFTLRYINGYTWQKVAFEMGGYDESAPRKKHDRYLRLRAESIASEEEGAI